MGQSKGALCLFNSLSASVFLWRGTHLRRVRILVRLYRFEPSPILAKKAKQYVEHRFWVNLSHCRLAWSLSLLIERGSHVKYTQKCSHSPLTGRVEWHFQITRKSETFEFRLNLFNLASDRWALTAHVQSKTVKVMDSWLFFNGSLMPLSQRSVQIIHHHELICRHGEWAQMSHEK